MIAVALVLALSASAAVAPSGPPTSTGTGGAAASVERLATQAAIDELRAGGNAIDAAVVAAGVLGVTEPFSCGIGGGGFMVIRTADGKVTTIDGRETAPAAMTPTSFWANGAPLPFNDARWSGLSVGVPGTVATWQEALENYGTITLGQALQAGMRVARDGFVVDQTFFDQTQAAVPWFDDIPATAALFLDPDGTPHDVGTVFRNPDLVRAYERIAQLGPKGLYRGAIADAIVNTVQHPNPAPTADHVWRPGVMTMRDLHDYAAPEREPTHVSYRGVDVYSMGPPSSGGSTVGEALNILEGYDLASMTREQAFHYFLEASRYSFADRNAYLADPGYFEVPLSGLLSKDYAATRRALITTTAASSPVAPGNPYPYVTGAGLRDGDAVGDDHAPRDVGQVGKRRLLHVHDRVDRRLGPRRAGLGLLAQQRAHRLQLRLDDSPEPRRRRQAAAQLDVADDRPPGRQAVSRARLAGRLDDHHDGAPDPLRPARPGNDAAAGDRRSAREPTQHGDDERGTRLPLEPASHGARGAGPWLLERRRDRRRNRNRVPPRRERARRGRARTSRRRERARREPRAVATAS